MQSLVRILKRSASQLDVNPKDRGGEEEEERKSLKHSLQKAESERLFDQFRLQDVQNDVKTKDALLSEKNKHIESLIPLHTENTILRERLKQMEDEVARLAREKQDLESRLMTQSTMLGDAYQKRMANARDNSTATINGHLQVLRMIFVKNKIPEDDLAQYVLCEDGIRTAVALNLI